MSGDEAEVELAAGQVVGDGELGAGDVGDPVVGVHVVYAEQVKAVGADPDILEKS